MALNILEDGTGTGFKAKVDDTKRLWGRNVSVTQEQEESSLGNGYIITTGFITLTSENQSAILYLENQDDFNFHIDRFVFNAEASTGGTSSIYEVEVCRNPASISGGTSTDATQSNVDFGSSNTLVITSEVGQEAATLTSGTLHEDYVAPLENDKVFPSNIILRKSSSIGIKITPPSGNTSLKISIDIEGHLKTHD